MPILILELLLTRKDFLCELFFELAFLAEYDIVMIFESEKSHSVQYLTFSKLQKPLSNRHHLPSIDQETYELVLQSFLYHINQVTEQD